jgi:RNA polymerase sigma factor for flagellar operon FliA
LRPAHGPSAGPVPAASAPAQGGRYGPPGPELQRLWREFKRTGDAALRNRLVEHYLYLVKVIGNRVAARLPRSIDVQDLRSAGVFGLMRAVENFDLDRGTPFESYCSTRVRGAILDALRAQDWVPRLVRARAARYQRCVETLRRRLEREPTSHEAAVALDLPIEEVERMRREAQFTTVFNLAGHDEDDDETPGLRRLDALMDRESGEPFERMVAHDLARALVRHLSRVEQTVVALYYHEGLTMREIGDVLGVSESRVCQIHTRTLQRLKTRLEGIEGYARPARS